MKLKFFLSKIIMFLSLTLIPVCVFGLLSGFYIRAQVQQEIQEKAQMVTERMRQSVEDLTTTLNIHKIATSSDARFHLALLSALSPDSTENIDMSDLNQAMQNLYYSLTIRSGVLSVYLTIENSPYFINGLSRETFENAIDNSWTEPALSHPDTDFFQLRYMKKNKFDTQLQPVVTVYQRMKYKELMAINLQPEYFNNLLDSISDYEGQVLLITNKDGQIFFHNHNAELLPTFLYQKESYLRSFEEISQVAGSDYFLNSGEFSGNYGLCYLSMIPRREVFRLSDTILKLTLVGGLISVLVSSLLAYLYTIRDCRQIFSIIDLFDRAERGEFTPPGRLLRKK